MTKRTRVTIKDVAKRAKVTPQTVSRAFRDTHDISEKTKNRILKIAAEMGYVKNSSATSLRYGASHLIAVVYDNLINCYFSIMIDFLQKSLKKFGYSIMTISVTDTHLKEDAYLSAVGHNVDGIISFMELSEEIPKLIRNYNIPVLLFGRRMDVDGVDCIHVDDITVGRLAAQALLSAGCKKLLYISESLALTCAYDRLKGFKSELTGHNVIPSVVANEPGQKLSVEEHLPKLYEVGEFPDGIFCFNDMIAFETLYVLEKYKLPLPKIIGVDDIQREMYFPKRLTTVGWDKLRMAEKAAELLVTRINDGESADVRFTEKVFLVEGATL